MRKRLKFGSVKVIRQLLTLSSAILLAFSIASHAESPAGAALRTYKILHVMSYHSPWRWTDGQLSGFKDGMADTPVEYRVFQLDSKRVSSDAAKEQKGREAIELIEAWKPDLVYTSDDEAQQYVTRHFIGSSLPFVFSGVNKPPSAYGFEKTPNVAGVLEEEHFVESVRLLQAIAPGAHRIAAVFDTSPIWEPVRRRMRERIALVPGAEIVSWDTITTFDEYKRKILEYPAHADAIALIGIFNFKDEHGDNVPYDRVLRWTAENSRLPDFSYWVDRVFYGTLCAVTVSEREQGRAAGRIARAILVDGKRPASFAMEPTVKGAPVISLARARQLGLQIRSSVLLPAEVISKFEWDQ